MVLWVDVKRDWWPRIVVKNRGLVMMNPLKMWLSITIRYVIAIVSH